MVMHAVCCVPCGVHIDSNQREAHNQLHGGACCVLCRFKEEDSDSKVMCQCAAPNCKGTLN